jgi:hypothetical protein
MRAGDFLFAFLQAAAENQAAQPPVRRPSVLFLPGCFGLVALAFVVYIGYLLFRIIQRAAYPSDPKDRDERKSN